MPAARWSDHPPVSGCGSVQWNRARGAFGFLQYGPNIGQILFYDRTRRKNATQGIALPNRPSG